MSSEFYLDSSFWGSKISSYRKCPRLYKLQWLDKLPDPCSPQADLEFGTCFHLAINDVLSGGAGLPIFNLYWDSLKDKQLSYGRLDWAALKDVGEKLLTRFIRLHLKHFRPLHMEERISMRLGQHRYEGTPDYLGFYKETPSIVDFKTSGSEYDKRKTISDDQMPMYAALAKEVYGFEAKQIVHYVFIKGECRIQVITKELTDTTQYSTLQDVTEVCDDLVTRKTWPKNPQNCVRGSFVCPYFETCFGGKK